MDRTWNKARPRWALICAGVLISLACGGMTAPPPAPAPVPAPPPPEPPTPVAPTFYYMPGALGVDDAGYAPWSPGDVLYVGVHNSRLRSAPTVDSEIVDKLWLGIGVEILEAVGQPEVLTKRRNVWYKIRTTESKQTGYLFGALLSPLRVPLWRQGSDEPQITVVTFNPDFEPRIRLWLPKSDRKYARDLSLTTQFVGGILTARSEPGGATEQLVVTLCDPQTKDCVEGRVRLDGDELVEL